MQSPLPVTLLLLLFSPAHSVKLLYASHVAVIGIQVPTSVDRNGSITIVDPSNNPNTISDPSLVQFLNTTYYESQQTTTLNSFKCSYGTVFQGTAKSCHDQVLLFEQTKQRHPTKGDSGTCQCTAGGGSNYCDLLNDASLAITIVQQAMFLADTSSSHNNNRRVLINRRRLGSDFQELNAVFKGVVLQIPDQTITKKIWPSTLVVQISHILCGQLSIQDLSIHSQQQGAAASSTVKASVQLKDLNVMCSANYRYDWGWFGGSGSVSAGGSKQSIRSVITLNKEGTATIDSCSSNVDLTQLSFS